MLIDSVSKRLEKHRTLFKRKKKFSTFYPAGLRLQALTPARVKTEWQEPKVQGGEWSRMKLVFVRSSREFVFYSEVSGNSSKVLRQKMA